MGIRQIANTAELVVQSKNIVEAQDFFYNGTEHLTIEREEGRLCTSAISRCGTY